VLLCPAHQAKVGRLGLCPAHARLRLTPEIVICCPEHVDVAQAGMITLLRRVRAWHRGGAISGSVGRPWVARSKPELDYATVSATVILITVGVAGFETASGTCASAQRPSDHMGKASY